MYLGDVSKTNRANQEDRDFLIGRTNQGLGNGDLHISLSWPNLVLLSHLSCRDHFCFLPQVRFSDLPRLHKLRPAIAKVFEKETTDEKGESRPVRALTPRERRIQRRERNQEILNLLL